MADATSTSLTFPFESNTLRVIVRDEEPWFVAADVCEALDIDNVSQAIRRLDDDETTLISNEGQGFQEAPALNLINESGLYSLILGSRKPEAKRFKKWVTAEVLPAIRRSGSYATPPVPALVGHTFERVVAERDTLRAMLAERVLKEEPSLRKAMYYFGIAGLTNKDRATLVGWQTAAHYMKAVRRLAILGLVEYQPNPKFAANAKKSLNKRRDAAPWKTSPSPELHTYPAGHPSRARPKSIENLTNLRARAAAKAAAKGGAQ